MIKAQEIGMAVFLFVVGAVLLTLLGGFQS